MKLKRSMAIIFTIIGLIVIAVIVGKVISTVQFNKQVKTLFSQSETSENIFSYNQLQGLPAPVQRYFRHVMKEGQPYISYVRLMHNGQFKTAPEKDWINIKGEQYFTTAKPGFVWQGSTALFTARDMYIANKGKLIVSFLSLFKIAGGQGEKYDHGELLRWLAESVWFPTNLLPNENLQWEPIDSLTAQLTFTYNGLSLLYLVSFNNKDEITQLQTKRYMGEADFETWIGKVSDYREKNGIVIPFAIEAIYRLKEGDYSYAKFNVTRIEYDIPEKFR
jgi:hypothetical protein